MNSPHHEQVWLQITVKCLKQVKQLGKKGFKTLYKNRRKERKIKPKIHAVTCQTFYLHVINIQTVYSADAYWICWTPQAHLKLWGLSSLILHVLVRLFCLPHNNPFASLVPGTSNLQLQWQRLLWLCGTAGTLSWCSGKNGGVQPPSQPHSQPGLPELTGCLCACK